MTMLFQKIKWVRANNKSHMNKFRRCAIMKRSKLKNKADKMGILSKVDLDPDPDLQKNRTLDF